MSDATNQVLGAQPGAVRVLVVGTGGVGSAFAAIAQRRSFFEQCALADYDPARPSALVAELDDDRFSGHGLDASPQDAVVSLIRETRADVVLNAVDPLFDVPVFDACIEAGVTYLDMAWRRRRSATLDDVVELLQGIGTMLTEISAQLDKIIRLGQGDEDEEADA